MMNSAKFFLSVAILGVFLPVSAKCILFADRDGDGFGSEKTVFDYDCPDDDAIPTGYSRKVATATTTTAM